MADNMNLIGVHSADYGSEFDSDSDAERVRTQRQDLAKTAPKAKQKLASKSEVTEEYNKEEGRKMRFHILGLDAYQRHKKFINDYLMYFGGTRADFKRDTSRDKTDIDVIHENHRFLWTDDDEADASWEKQMAKKYHDKLFKEYCITDLSRYKENKIAMRWRMEKEVIVGKGQFSCGNKHCESTEGLRTWEVNFGYLEHGEKKNALVKLRLCSDCSYKLNYHKRRREVTKEKKKHKLSEDDKDTKRQKTASDDSAGASSSDDRGDTTNAESSSASASAKPGDTSLWAGPVKVTEEKSRDEEFEDYFEDMFL